MRSKKALRRYAQIRRKHKEYCGKIMDKHGYLSCERCRSTQHLSVHEIKFRSQGGELTDDNMELLCLKCHGSDHGVTYKY